MPLVLAENERTIGGLYDSWQDTTGREYHFPNVYRRKVEAGDWFVYYRGVRTLTGRRPNPEYFGMGRITGVWRDAAIPETAPKRGWRWFCSISDYVPFPEPVSWKRNGELFEQIKQNRFRDGVRSISQETYDAILAGSGLVNVGRNAWRLPTPDSRHQLDEKQAWPLVRAAAEGELRNPTPFSSTQTGQRYRIIDVSERQIVIDRLDSPGQATVSAGEVERGIRYLNVAGGRLGRRAMHYTVAKEVTIVHLHPSLRWSDDYNWIEVAGDGLVVTVPPVYADFGQAPDDDPTQLATFARRIRAGQPKFRENLLKLYDERCAITSWGPAAVLEAAHVLLHSHSGNNHVDNGLLLRADVHVLFDKGLIRVHPDTYTVMLDPTLRDGPYGDLHGRSLRPRVNGGHPKREYLRLRWKTSAVVD